MIDCSPWLTPSGYRLIHCHSNAHTGDFSGLGKVLQVNDSVGQFNAGIVCVEKRGIFNLHYSGRRADRIGEAAIVVVLFSLWGESAAGEYAIQNVFIRMSLRCRATPLRRRLA